MVIMIVICIVTRPRQILREEHNQNQMERFGFARIPPNQEFLKVFCVACCTVCSFQLFNFKDIKVLEEVQRMTIKRLWDCLTDVGQSRKTTAPLNGPLLRKPPHGALRPPPSQPWERAQTSIHRRAGLPLKKSSAGRVQSTDPCSVVSSKRV